MAYNATHERQNSQLFINFIGAKYHDELLSKRLRPRISGCHDRSDPVRVLRALVCFRGGIIMYRYQVLIGQRLSTGGICHSRVPFATWHAAENYRVWAESHKTEPVTPCVGNTSYTFEYAILEALGV